MTFEILEIVPQPFAYLHRTAPMEGIGQTMGECFDDSPQWWTVDCSSDLALYTVVESIPLDEPVADMSDEDADEQGAACATDWYWQMTDLEGRTHGFICGNDV